MNEKHAKQLAKLLNERNELVISYNENKILTSADNYKYLVDEHDDVIAGVEIKQVQWYQWEIRHLTVTESQEGKGYGSKLVKLAEKRAKDGKVRIMQCTIRENNGRSKCLFSKNGYKQVSTFFNQDSKNNVGVWQKIICPVGDVLIKIQNNHKEILDTRQLEIYKGLKNIGPEISAFYLDGIKIFNDDGLVTKSYLLAHIAREIEGGLRDVLVTKAESEKKCKECGQSIEKINHVGSICRALGVDKEDSFAEKWYKIAKDLHKYAHRHGAWKTPREKSEFEKLWKEFENILFELAGTYYNLLDRVDRILKYEIPTEEIIETLPNLLELDARYSYFFRNLKSLQWLKPLKEKSYFAPEKNPKPQEMPDQPGYYRVPHWTALDYLENIANKNGEHPSDEITNLLIDIVNSIANYREGNGERIENYITDWILVKIICKLPIERITKEHIEFIGTLLKSKWDSTLVVSEIGKSVLPKLISNQAKELVLKLMDVILEYQKTDKVSIDKYTSLMDEYWLNEILKEHKPAIAKLCGIEAAEIAVKKMISITKEDESQFSNIWIPTIEDHPQTNFPERYECQLVYFVRDMFELSEPDQIKKKINVLIEKEHPIFKRIFIHTINYHYNDLNELFWSCKGNPLDEIWFKHELYELLTNNCSSFTKKQIDTVLGWIESGKYHIPPQIKGNKDAVDKLLAYKKKEWLLSLLETKDTDVLANYEKYQKINPIKVEHPGFVTWTGIEVGTTSPIEKFTLLNKSNKEIAEYLISYKEEKGLKKPSIEGLSETLRECIFENPKKFSDEMKPFLNVQRFYQHALLRGFSEAWSAKKDFSWDNVLDFILKIIESSGFWNEKYDDVSFNHRNWIISQTAELIEEGTKDDAHAFDAKFLPETEKILLIFAEKTETDLPEMNDILTSILNSSKGKIFSAMINYSLRCARLCEGKKGERWAKAVKDDFDKRLNLDVEPSLEFSVTLGKYLPNLFYLDEKWATDKINQIFPKESDIHWKAAFIGYLFYSKICENIYFLLRKNGHYDKALQTEFCDADSAHYLVQHICIGCIEGWEKLDDNTSLISQMLKKQNVNQLSEIVRFFWMQRNKPAEKIQVIIKPLWKKMFELLLKIQEKPEYQNVISDLSKWLSLIDEIDDDVLKWLKLSAKYTQSDVVDMSFFIEYLLKQATMTPEKVGEIYLEVLNANVYPIYKMENIQKIVQILYEQDQKEIADKICNIYGEKGIDLLRPIYEKYRTEKKKI